MQIFVVTGLPVLWRSDLTTGEYKLCKLGVKSLHSFHLLVLCGINMYMRGIERRGRRAGR
jgi:hypothetical protein